MLTVGLHDNTFRQSECSTAHATPKHLRYVRDDLDFPGVTLFTDGYIYRAEAIMAKGAPKIGWIHEPEQLIPDVYAHAPEAMASGRFDSILTYHPDLLKLPGFKLGIYGGCWLDERDWGLFPKTGLCSMLIGNKNATSGHQLRRATASLLDRSRLPVDFFGSAGTPTDYSQNTKFIVNAPFAFSVITETQSLDNLFTDWTLDALALGTVPILNGAPNIGDYFNKNGILSFTTPAECADIVAGLSFDLYESMLPAVADNLARVAQYACAEDWLFLNVLKEYDHA